MKTDKQLAIEALNLRDRAHAGRWLSRRSKSVMAIICAGMAFVIWGVCREPDQVTIGIACFFAGIVYMYFCTLIGSRRLVRNAWPFTEKVTDWEKVREIADQPVNPPAPTPDSPSESN